MKKFVKLMLCIMFLSVLLGAPQSVSAKTNKGINIKKTFAKGIRYEMSRKVYDKNQDGYLDKREVKSIKKLFLYTYQNEYINENFNLRGISKLKYVEKIYFDAEGYAFNLQEIKKFRNLKSVEIKTKLKKAKILDFRKSKNIKNLDLSMLTKTAVVKVREKNKIENLYLEGIKNSISVANKCSHAKKIDILGNKNKSSLNLINRKKLTNLYLFDVKKIKNLNIENCPKLEKIYVSETDTINFNIKSNAKLKNARIYDSKIVNWTMDNLDELRTLEIGNVELSSILMNALNNLKKVEMDKVKKLSQLSFSNLIRLQEINILHAKKLISLSLDNLPRLKKVSCAVGVLRELNINGKNDIREMSLGNNKLTRFSYTNLQKLNRLFIHNNQLEGRFDMTLYPCLDDFNCSHNRLTEIYGGTIDEAISYINCNNNQLKLIDFRGMKNGYILGLDCKNNPNVEIYGVVEDGSWDASAKYYCTV